VFLPIECDGMYLLVWQQLNMHLGYSDRLSIYHSLVEEISHLKLSGQIEIDEKHYLMVVEEEEGRSVDGVQLSTKI
jgi:hypothetical protein